MSWENLFYCLFLPLAVTHERFIGVQSLSLYLYKQNKKRTYSLDVKLSPRYSRWLPDCSIILLIQCKPVRTSIVVLVTRCVEETRSVQTNHQHHVNVYVHEQALPPVARAAAAASWDCIKALSHISGSTEEAQPLRWVKGQHAEITSTSFVQCFVFNARTWQLLSANMFDVNAET